MASRGRYSQSNEWDSREDYNSSLCEPAYLDDDSSDVNLDHCRLYIRNIPKALNEEGLRAAFAKFGSLVEVYQSKDPTKNFGLIKYETPGEAKLAMMKMNRTEPLKLQIFIAHRSKTEARPNRDWQDRNTTGGRDRNDRSTGRDREETSSVASRNRASRVQDETPNGDNNMDDLLMEDDYGFSDILDPNLHLELENLKLEQLKVREEQLQCKQKLILLKQAERKPMTQLGNRCILPDGKIVVRNAMERASRDADVSFTAGAGDSVWTDKKHLTKKAASAARQSASATGGGPSTAPSLSRWELKICSIMGDGFADPQTSAATQPFVQQLKLPGLQREAVQQCVVCGRGADAYCAGCGITPYCSEQCQRRDWHDRHSAVCHNLARMNNEIGRADVSIQDIAVIEPTHRVPVLPAAPLRRPHATTPNNKREYQNRDGAPDARSSAGGYSSKASVKSNESNGKEDRINNSYQKPRQPSRNKNFNQPKENEPEKAAAKPASPKKEVPADRPPTSRNMFNRAPAAAKNPEPAEEPKKVEPVKPAVAAAATAAAAAKQHNLVPKQATPDPPTAKPEVVKPQEATPPHKETAVKPASVSDVTPTRRQVVPKNYLVEKMPVGASLIMSVDAKAADCRVTRGDYICLTMADAFEQDYHSLCEDLVLDCNNDEVPAKLVPGETISYFNPEDCGWYRARCLNPTTLALLDSGRIVSVTATDKCRKLPSKYETIPEFCVVLASKAVQIGASVSCKILSQTSDGYKISLTDVESNASLGEGEVFRWLPTVEYQAASVGIPEISRPPLTDGSKVLMVLADKLDRVFVRPADSDSQRMYNDVLQQVLLSAMKGKPLAAPPSPGQTVIGKFNDNNHYRALVRRVNVKQNKYQIEYAEYGNVEVSTLENLFPCPAELDLSTVKTQVAMLKLAPPTELSAAATEFIQELLQDEELVLALPAGRKTAPSGSEASLALAKNRLDVGTRLVEMCTPNWKKIEERGGDVVETEHIMYTDLKHTSLPAAGCTVEVVDVSTLGGGSVCGYDRNDPFADVVFKQLTAKMADYCNSELGRQPYLPKPEELCIAQLPPYPQWFRAVFLDLVSGPGSSEAKLCYVDYGNIETVPVTLIRKMMPEFVEGFPAMGLCLDIRGFPKDPTNDQLARAVNYMQMDEEGKGHLQVYNCEKVDDEGEGLYLVDAPELLKAMNG